MFINPFVVCFWSAQHRLPICQFLHFGKRNYDKWKFYENPCRGSYRILGLGGKLWSTSLMWRVCFSTPWNPWHFKTESRQFVVSYLLLLLLCITVRLGKFLGGISQVFPPHMNPCHVCFQFQMLCSLKIQLGLFSVGETVWQLILTRTKLQWGKEKAIRTNQICCTSSWINFFHHKTDSRTIKHQNDF